MSGWNKQLNGLELNTEEQIHSLEFATSQEAWVEQWRKQIWYIN